MTKTSDQQVIYLDDTYDQNIITIKNNCKTKMVSFLKFGYIGILLSGVFSAFTLYVDHKCTNTIVPKNYLHFRKLLSQGDNETVFINNGSTGNEFSNNIDQMANPMNTQISNSSYQCQNDAICGHGTCKVITDIHGIPIGSKCICEIEYMTYDNGICEYQQLIGLTALLLSIFVGNCGIDRCFLARGNGCDICIGVLKGLTCGGLGIWWIIDIILISMGNLLDGNGQVLTKI